jgi:GH25 family lysozyme M1 (1,4-beta-N-acetylmuramidase)
MQTIRHQDVGVPVVVAKLLTGYVTVSGKVEDEASFVKLHQTFDAEYVAYVVTWQGKRGLTPDGVIGPRTWAKIAEGARTCSTSKNRISGWTLAAQLLLDSNITADAIYGPRTKAAVAAYQSAKGLAADGICGPRTWGALLKDEGTGNREQGTGEATGEGASAGSTEAPKPSMPTGFVQPVDYKQGDSRWGKKMYSNHGDTGQTMANSGCGPTAMADIVATVKDKSKTPYDLAKLAMKWGDRTDNSGTAWTFMIPHIMNEFEFTKAIQTANIDIVKACLDAGGYVVCSMGPGYWTKGGHFICAWKYDATYVYCNDPASGSRVKQKLTEFVKERKQFFCFWPEPVEDKGTEGATAAAETSSVSADGAATEGLTGPASLETAHSAVSRALAVPKGEGKRGSIICDVSRFQGKINWDVLAPQLAFAVIKATGLYRNGADTQYMRNVSEAARLGVPFHVYSYLYCTSESTARRDAKLYFDTVKAGGHWPLFWVLDLEAGWGAKDKDAPRLAAAFEAELRRLAREQGPGEIRVAGYVAQEKYSDWAIDYDHFAYLWIPGYGEKWKPKMPCDLWQYTSTGSLPGISGNVDLNVLMGRKPLSFFTGGED